MDIHDPGQPGQDPRCPRGQDGSPARAGVRSRGAREDPGRRDARQGGPAPGRPRAVGAAATAAPGGDHARRLRDDRRGGLRRPRDLPDESAGPAASRQGRLATGPGGVLPWLTRMVWGVNVAADLSGRTALITEAASGIGSASALAIAAGVTRTAMTSSVLVAD